MTIEDVFDRLESIAERYKLATRDSFEMETKNGKKLFRSVLNVVEELKEERCSDELPDDDYYEGTDDFPDYDRVENLTTKIPEEDEKPKPKFTMDDIIGDDDDTVW